MPKLQQFVLTYLREVSANTYTMTQTRAYRYEICLQSYHHLANICCIHWGGYTINQLFYIWFYLGNKVK